VKYKTVCVIYLILAGLNTVFFLFFPELSMNILQRSTNEVGILTTQMSGACALGLVVMTWISRNTTDPHIQKIIVLGNLFTVAALVVVELQGLRSGAFNWIGWAFVAGDSLMTLAFFSLFLQISKKNIIPPVKVQ
jgi:hypothetical protein